MWWAASTLESVLELLEDVPGTVQLCEKTHGAGSLLAKFHGLHSVDTIALRSLVVSARPIFVFSRTAAAEKRTLDNIEKLRVPVRYSWQGVAEQSAFTRMGRCSLFMGEGPGHGLRLLKAPAGAPSISHTEAPTVILMGCGRVVFVVF